MTRLYLPAPLTPDSTVPLPDAAFRHLVQVLRTRAGDALTVFDGEGQEFDAELKTIGKREATVQLGSARTVDRESPLAITLVQGVSKGERMDFAVQKAVELGAAAIAPVITERCNVKLDAARWAKKCEHWQAILVAASEQSGRTRLPRLHPVMVLAEWLAQASPATRLVLDPEAAQPLVQAALGDAVEILVGPEGGLSPRDLEQARAVGCIAVGLGPRILRTETAALAALAVLQARGGDWR